MSQNSEELIAINWNQTNSQEFDFLDKNNINQDYNNDYELFLSKKTDLNEFTLINSADHFSSNENREQEFFKNLNYFKNLDKIDSFIQEEDKQLSNESHKIKKTRKKWDNFSFTIPDYIKLLDPKAQRKEIQKLKNRISAQLSRDKKKIESDSIQTMNYQLEQENRKLLKEISVIRQENEFLLKKMSEFKCIRCGFSNSQKEEKEVLSDTNDNSISPFGTRHFSRTSSFSLFLGTLTILGTLALFCLVVPFYSNDSQMSNSNMFAQINQSINPQYECKKFFFKNEKEKWRETMKIRKKFSSESLYYEIKYANSKKLTFQKEEEKFLEKKGNNFPIVPWNYFIDKITIIIRPYPYIKNITTNSNEIENKKKIKINGEWIHLLITQFNYTPESIYIILDNNFKDYWQYLEILTQIYVIREFNANL